MLNNNLFMGKQKLLSLSLVCLLIVSVIFISGCITSKDSTTSGETKTENILYETYTSSNENGSITITKNKLTKKYTVDMTIYMNYSELEDNPLFEPSYLLNVTTKATCVILSSAFNETIREAFKNFTEQWKEFEKKEETKQGGVMKETKEKKIDLEGYEPSRISLAIMDVDKVTKLSECIITGPREEDMSINIYNLPEIKCIPDWKCTSWSKCSKEGIQTRTCIDKNNCGVITGKPPESQPCTPPIVEPEPIIFSGTGQEATTKFNLERGISIFEMKHDGSRNFIIVLYSTSGQYIDLLVNTIGSFDGSKLVPIDTKGEYLLDITADGNWEVKIKQPRPTTGKSVPLTLSGTGQKASEIFYLNKGIARFEMKHDGRRNFIIVLYSANGDYIDLLVNTIGNFDGSKATPISKSGLYLLDILADGNWEVSIDQ